MEIWYNIKRFNLNRISIKYWGTLEMNKFVLLPVDKIEKGSSIIIYAAGDVGKMLLKQIEILKYCKVVCFADLKADQIGSIEKYACVLPEKVPEYFFDKIVIAKSLWDANLSIKSYLLRLGVPEEKIVLLEGRYFIEGYTEKTVTPADTSWGTYYKNAEGAAREQYSTFMKELFEKYSAKNFSVMDFGCGEGRIVNLILSSYNRIICCDIPDGPLEVCKKRFATCKNVEYVCSTEEGIQMTDSECDMVYSWDAMVHFDYDMMAFYIPEIYRVLKKDGIAIIHHSNLKNASDVTCTSNWVHNFASRSAFSKEEFEKLAVSAGFELIEQRETEWSKKKIDCISIVRK